MRTLFLAALICALAYSLNYGITCTNDGSHFALINTLYDTGKTPLNDNVRYALQDSAYFNGTAYSDRFVGVALLAIPFLKLMSPIQGFFRPIRLDPWFVGRGPTLSHAARASILMLLPALALGALFVIFASIFRLFEMNPSSSHACAALFCLGTLALRYGTVLYSHIFATVFVAASVLAMLHFLKKPEKHLYFYFSVFALAFAALAEQAVVVLMAPLLLICLNLRLVNLRIVLLSLVPGVFLFGFQGLYNYLCFDSPFNIAHINHSDTVALGKTYLDIFNFNSFFYRIKTLVIGFGPYHGLMTGSPFLVIALGVVFFGFRFTKFEMGTVIWSVSSIVIGVFPALAFSGNPGFDADYRQFLFVIPFFAIPFAMVLNQISHWRFKFKIELVVVLGVYSFVCQLQHIRHNGQTLNHDIFINGQAAFQNILVPTVIVFATIFVLRSLWHKSNLDIAPIQRFMARARSR